MKTTSIPCVSIKAKISEIKRVRDVYALDVINATYRGAKFSGVIELVNGTDSIKRYKGAYRANAKLTWFGRVLSKRNPFINLDGASITLLPAYSGNVVSGLG